jgi:hypothetical protein
MKSFWILALYLFTILLNNLLNVFGVFNHLNLVSIFKKIVFYKGDKPLSIATFPS